MASKSFYKRPFHRTGHKSNVTRASSNQSAIKIGRFQFIILPFIVQYISGDTTIECGTSHNKRIFTEISSYTLQISHQKYGVTYEELEKEL